MVCMEIHAASANGTAKRRKKKPAKKKAHRTRRPPPPPPTQLGHLNTPQDGAGYLRVSERGVRDWIKRGLIKVVRIGRCVRIPRAELERVAQEGIPEVAERHAASAA